ncbi:inactive pancreatic lipase-related protein 1-like [Argonauta hians]
MFHLFSVATTLLSCLLAALQTVAFNHPHYSTYIKKRCFRTLGCFTITYPYNNTFLLPDSPSRIGTRFWIYTPYSFKRRPLRPDTKWCRYCFKRRFPTKVIIPGFNPNHEDFLWIHHMALLLQKQEPANIITVDWSKGAGFPYEQAVANAFVVGKQITQLLLSLYPRQLKFFTKLHLIGHSLGAHIAAFAANGLNHTSRITGLDPAGPNYEGAPAQIRLDPSDADFVDVIHTDGSTFSAIKGFGVMEQMGDVDFYPNGGKIQPGCRGAWMRLIYHAYKSGFKNASNYVGCSHSRAIQLFMESINSTCFRAVKCDSHEDFINGLCVSGQFIPMGYHLPKKTPKGSYYLNTKKEFPYCAHNYIVNVYLPHNDTIFHTYVKVIGEKGSTKKTLLYSQPTNHSGRHKQSIVVLTHIDLGEIQEVHIMYRPPSGGFVDFLYRYDIQVLGVSVLGLSYPTKFQSCENATITKGEIHKFQQHNSISTCT